MAPSHIDAYSNFTCELRIKQARNVEFVKSTKNLFARFYLPTGNNKGIKLNSKIVSTKSLPFWDESFNLDCSCPKEFLENLNQQNLVLELRKRKIWGSELIGKGAIPWKVILQSKNMELKTWLKMELESESDCKEVMLTTPEVEVEIKIQISSVAETEMEKQNKRRFGNWNECGCKNGHDHNTWCNAQDCDIFAFGAALEAF